MKRKILSFAICICMVLACVVGFVGCGSKLSIEDANEEFNQLENIDVLMDAFDENGHNAELNHVSKVSGSCLISFPHLGQLGIFLTVVITCFI